MLTGCGFQLLFGKIYQIYSPKWVYLTAILLFEIGSAICGAAPNSVAFIFGRAIAGLGSGGMYSGALIIVVYTIPPHKRAVYTGSFAAVFGIASVIGPLVGGAFTSRVTWRWCFYINLPIGAVTMVLITMILNVDKLKDTSLPIREKMKQLDPLGNVLFLTSIICLLLALQWGGSTYPWSDGRIIALLVLFGLLFLCFLIDQIMLQERATVPPRIFKQRSISAGSIYMFGGGSAMIVFVYYLPFYFQAVQGVDAIESGIRNFPMVLSLTIDSVLCGILVNIIGYYTPFMIAGSIVMSAGAGLLTTLNTSSGESMWIGYQVLFGLGLGMGLAQPNLAAQTVLNRRDVSIGASIMVLAQNLGGAIFVSVGQNILENKFAAGLGALGTGIDPTAVVSSGATNIRNTVSPGSLPQVIEAYNAAIQDTFYTGLATACLTIVGALCMEWRSTKKGKQPSSIQGTEEEASSV